MYWDLSPREGEVIVSGVLKRLRREHNDRMTQAWWGALFPNSKPALTLKDALIEVDERPKVKDWREIKAALLWAMPPKGNG